VVYKAELAEAEDYDAHLAEIREWLNRVRSPFRSAEYFEVEESGIRQPVEVSLG